MTTCHTGSCRLTQIAHFLHLGEEESLLFKAVAFPGQKSRDDAANPRQLHLILHHHRRQLLSLLGTY